MVWSQCTASRGTNELVGCRVAFGAVWCRSQNWFSNFPRDLLHVPATRPKWALSSSPTLPPAYRWAVGLRSCHVARSTRTGLLSIHDILDISASHHPMVYPLTCTKADGESVSCVSAINAAIAGAVAAAECPIALSFAPSRRLPTLTLAAPSKDPKKTSHHHLLSP